MDGSWTDDEQWSFREELWKTAGPPPAAPLVADPPLSPSAQALWDLYINPVPGYWWENRHLNEFMAPSIFEEDPHLKTDGAIVKEFLNHPQVKEILEYGKKYSELRRQKLIDFFSDIETKTGIILDPATYVTRSFAQLMHSKKMAFKPYTEDKAQILAIAEIQRIYGGQPDFNDAEVKRLFNKFLGDFRLKDDLTAGRKSLTEEEFNRWKSKMDDILTRNEWRRALFLTAFNQATKINNPYIVEFSETGAVLSITRAKADEILSLELALPGKPGMPFQKPGGDLAKRYQICYPPPELTNRLDLNALNSSGLGTIRGASFSVAESISPRAYRASWGIIGLDDWNNHGNPLRGPNLNSNEMRTDQWLPLNQVRALFQRSLGELPLATELKAIPFSPKSQALKYQIMKLQKYSTTKSTFTLLSPDHGDGFLFDPDKSVLYKEVNSAGKEILVPDSVKFSLRNDFERIKLWGIAQSPRHWINRLDQAGKLDRPYVDGTYERVPKISYVPDAAQTSQTETPKKVTPRNPPNSNAYVGARAEPRNSAKSSNDGKPLFDVHGRGTKQGELFLTGDWDDQTLSEASLKKHWSILGRDTPVKIQSVQPIKAWKRLAIPTPIDHALSTFVLADVDGKTLKLGRDYKILKSKKDGTYWVEFANATPQTVWFGASFTGKTKTRAPNRALKRLKTDALESVLTQVADEGLTLLAGAIRERLKTSKGRLSIRDIEALFQAVSFYSYVPEITHGIGQGRFGKFTKFLDSSGRICAQCDGSNALFAEFMNAYFETAKVEYRAEIQTGLLLKDGSLRYPPHARTAILKTKGASEVVYLADVTPRKMDPRNENIDMLIAEAQKPPTPPFSTKDSELAKRKKASVITFDGDAHRAVPVSERDIQDVKALRENLKQKRQAIITAFEKGDGPEKGSTQSNKVIQKKMPIQPNDPLAKTMRVAERFIWLLDGGKKFAEVERELRAMIAPDRDEAYTLVDDLLNDVSTWAQNQEDTLNRFLDRMVREKRELDRYRDYFDSENKEKLFELLQSLKTSRTLSAAAVVEFRSQASRCAARPTLQELFESLGVTPAH